MRTHTHAGDRLHRRSIIDLDPVVSSAIVLSYSRNRNCNGNGTHVHIDRGLVIDLDRSLEHSSEHACSDTTQGTPAQ